MPIWVKCPKLQAVIVKRRTPWSHLVNLEIERRENAPRRLLPSLQHWLLWA